MCEHPGDIGLFEDRAEFEEVLVSLGLPVEALDQLEPWYAAMTLSLLPLMQSGYDPQSGVEMALSGQADAKTRAALETIEEQLELFESFGERLPEALEEQRKLAYQRLEEIAEVWELPH